jgi:hypothetical protein
MVRTFHHLFFLKQPRRYEEGQPMSIYLRVTVDGQRGEMATGRQIVPSLWSNGHIAAKRLTDDLRELQSYLHTLEEKLYDAHQALLRENKTITAETLKNKYTGASEKARMLVPIFQKHNDEVEELVPTEFSAGTLQRYKTTLAHMEQFLKWKYNLTDIHIRDINHEFITDFDFFLRSVRKCANNSTVSWKEIYHTLKPADFTRQLFFLSYKTSAICGNIY